MAIQHRTNDGLFRPDFLPQGTVYGPDAQGRPTVVLKQGLYCTLIPVSTARAESGPARNELIQRRELHWQGDYEIAETGKVEVEIDDVRWRTVVGTFDLEHGPTGETFYRRCDVTRIRPS